MGSRHGRLGRCLPRYSRIADGSPRFAFRRNRLPSPSAFPELVQVGPDILGTNRSQETGWKPVPGLFEKAEGLYPAATAVGNGQSRWRKSGLVGQQANQLGVGAAFLRRTRQPDAKLQIAVRPPQRTEPDAGRTGRHHDSDGPSPKEQRREFLIIGRPRVQDCQTASPSRSRHRLRAFESRRQSGIG